MLRNQLKRLYRLLNYRLYAHIETLESTVLDHDGRIAVLEERVRHLVGSDEAACDLNVATTSGHKRRLLAVYNLAHQPFSIGDILVIQEAALVLRDKHDLGCIDFAIVYNPQRPASCDPAFANINQDNVLHHLNTLIPAAQFNAHHGSLHVFNSHAQLQRFIRNHADDYYVWPPPHKIGNAEYLYYVVLNRLLHGHYHTHGTIPKLGGQKGLSEWAQSFLAKHAGKAVPITVQIRNNKRYHFHRNSKLEVWLEFFRHCESRYPAKFIVICARGELEDCLRGQSNVILAKDHDTSVDQDLALVQAASMHMGASSGPGTVAWFNDKPYLIVNTDLIPHYYRDIMHEVDGTLRFRFAAPWQRFTVGPETTALLSAEFARTWAALDVRTAAGERALNPSAA